MCDELIRDRSRVLRASLTMVSFGDGVLCFYCRQNQGDRIPDFMHRICVGESSCWDFGFTRGWHTFYTYHFTHRALAWQRMLHGRTLMTLLMPNHHQRLPENVVTHLWYFLWY